MSSDTMGNIAMTKNADPRFSAWVTVDPNHPTSEPKASRVSQPAKTVP